MLVQVAGAVREFIGGDVEGAEYADVEIRERDAFFVHGEFAVIDPDRQRKGKKYQRICERRRCQIDRADSTDQSTDSLTNITVSSSYTC
ncbi:MAG: hypothetical protein ACSHX4_14380 [Opitutaceae bacterium]